jgi:striatin 1/3/4
VYRVTQWISAFDVSTGQRVTQMPAHTECVTALANCHGNNGTLVSVGHDSSVRFWDKLTWGCVQELSLHRRKGDEAIHSVASHPLIRCVATAGADATIRLLH